MSLRFFDRSAERGGGRSRRGQVRASAARPGMILVVVLGIISVLALLGTSFSFYMNADVASVQAMMDRQQARLAAESGLDRTLLLLREDRLDMDLWYNNANLFRRILVWAPGRVGASESLADQEAVEGRRAWRFSVVSYRNEGDTARIRYGITAESAKLNLNTASRGQLLALFESLDLKDITPQELVDPLIDWRDSDDVPVSDFGAESSYYMSLDPPYRAKNRPLQTVEELLRIKGFNGRIVYGEDYNRNGYLDDNEDDEAEEQTFPPDDGDGVLDHGLLSYATIYSYDFNTGTDNKFRANINLVNFTDLEKLPDHLVDEIRPEIFEFITEARKRGHKFRSVGELLGLAVYEDGSTNYDGAWEAWSADLQAANQAGLPQAGEQDEAGDDASDGSLDDGFGDDGAGADGAGAGDRDTAGEADQPADTSGDDVDLDAIDAEIEEMMRKEGIDPNKLEGRRRSHEPNTAEAIDPYAKERVRTQQSRRGGGEEDQADAGDEGGRDRRPGGRTFRDEYESALDEGGEGGSGDRRGGRGRRGGEDGGGEDGGAGGGGSGGGGSGKGKGTPIESPVETADMEILLDRLTVTVEPTLPGLVHVATAPPEVLRAIPGLTDEEVQAIVSRRDQIIGLDKMTPAWLVSNGILAPEKFAVVCNAITGRASQFGIDVIGFADHVGANCRIEAVVEMQGHLAQLRYYREITPLGLGFPVKEDQRSEGFSFDDR